MPFTRDHRCLLQRAQLRERQSYDEPCCRHRKPTESKAYMSPTIGRQKIDEGMRIMELEAGMRHLTDTLATIVELVDLDEVKAVLELQRITPPTAVLLKIAAEDGRPEGIGDEPQDRPW